MKYLIATLIAFCALDALAGEKLTGDVLQVRDNVAYVKSTDGKKVPVILNDKTFYRKKKILKKGKKKDDRTEFYQPLISRGDKVTLTYDADTVDPITGAIKASDVLVVIE